VSGGEGGDEREEHELAGGARRGEDAADQAAALDEPAAGDGGDERHGHGAGADADQHAPAQEQLPAGGHEDGEPAARGDQDEGARDDAAHAEAVHERGGER
jgi:hypothetical protein